VLALLLSGRARPASWAEPQRVATFEDVKGIVENLAARWNMDGVEFGAWQPRPGIDHPGRSATILAANKGESVQIGLAFEIDPRLLAAYEVRAEHVAFALVNLDVVSPLTNRAPTIKSAPTLPVVERDIAVVVGRNASASQVAATIRSNAGPNLASLALFDRYQGASLEPGQVSLAYRLTFQPGDEALSDAALDEAMANVTHALEREVGGHIRSGG